MEFSDFDSTQFILKRFNRSSFNITYNNASFEFWTPKLYIPFGLEEKFDSYFINYELIDFKKDKEIQQFFDFLVNIEKSIISQLDLDKDDLNSQLRITDDNPILYTKIIQKNNKITTSIKNDKYENINIFSIKKNTYGKLYLIIDKIWYKNSKFYFKYKIKDMIYYDNA
jgi:hypothetical protein